LGWRVVVSSFALQRRPNQPEDAWLRVLQRGTRANGRIPSADPPSSLLYVAGQRFRVDLMPARSLSVKPPDAASPAASAAMA
jgi:hypothetical protein